MDEYFSLKNQVETLVQTGTLSHLTKGERQLRVNYITATKQMIHSVFARINLVSHSQLKVDHEEKRVYHMEAYRDLDFVGGAGVFSLESEPIAFTDKNLKGVALAHKDTVVITTDIGKSIVARFLVDGGASVNMLYTDYWGRMALNAKHLI